MSTRMPIVAVIAVGLLVTCQVRADEPTKPSGEDGFDLYRGIVEGMPASVLEDGQEMPLKLQSGPLLSYQDETNNYTDGTAWVWGYPGRPRALLSISYNRSWVYEFVTLSTAPLKIDTGKGKTWRPTAQWEPQLLSDAPPPAKTERGQALQIRQQARRFSAYLDEGTQLRLVPKPVYRYGRSDTGTLGGALFFLSKGTNPEALLVIELHRNQDSIVQWHYACRRLTIGKLTVELDGKPVWERPYIPFRSTKEPDPYWIFSRRATEAERARLRRQNAPADD